MENEEELDFVAGERKLIKETEGRRKPKSKKRTKDDSAPVKAPTKQQVATLPLSLLPGTTEDKAQHAARMSALKNNLAQAKDYKPSLRPKVGDVIKHKTFGIGFVIQAVGSHKAEVLFAEGRKLLVMGQDA